MGSRMNSLVVLVSAPYVVNELERFQTYFDSAGIGVIVADVEERLSEEELLRYAGTIDGALCGDDAFTAQVLRQSSPRLKIISKWGTGIDSIDLKAARRLNIRVTNTPGAFTEAVADSVIGYVLAFARQLPWMDRDVKSGEWTKRPTRALHESTLGVIGVGRIGKAVLRRAHGFGMRLLGNDIVEIDHEFLSAHAVSTVELDELLAESDFISLNCDLNSSSRGLIEANALLKVRPEAVLINTARGGIVDQAALVEALESDRIAGAALDVFEDEPLPADSPLCAMDNVMLAPHNANSSPSAWEKVHWSSMQNLFDGLGLDPLEKDLVSESKPA